VLAICGGTLPSWCSQLLFSCKFLFPFDIRRRYFYCTAFGLARALHHLQQLQNAEGGSAPNVDREARELRVGRLTRQKVCGLSGCSVDVHLDHVHNVSSTHWIMQLNVCVKSERRCTGMFHFSCQCLGRYKDYGRDILIVIISS